MCLRPVNIHDPSCHKRMFQRESSFLVGCGKCVECLKDRQNSWKLRLCNEASNWRHVYFFTLTYNEASVPRNHLGRTTSSVSDIQNWLKRWRTNFTRSFGLVPDFKYFICAEYGPEGTYFYKGKMRQSTMRPHYHGILFTDYEESMILPLFLSWSDNFGYYKLDEICKSGRLREERSSVANYVSKYCCKGEFASRKGEIERKEIERAFTLCSKGIGSSYITMYKKHHLCGLTGSDNLFYVPRSPEFIERIVSRKFVLDGSFKYRMPRYYSDRIYKIPVTEVKEVLNFITGEYEIQKRKRFSSDNPLSYQIYSLLSSRVRERDSRQLQYIDICRSQGVDPRIAEAEIARILHKEASLSFKLRTFYADNAQRNASLLFTNI